MGFPCTYRTENGNGLFIDFRTNLGNRRELTTSYSSQQNGRVESAILRAFKAGHAVCLGVRQPYQNIRLVEIRGCNDVEGTMLPLESLLWASECFNRAATSVKDELCSPYEVLTGADHHCHCYPSSSPHTTAPRASGSLTSGIACTNSRSSGTTMGPIVVNVWASRRGESCIRATSARISRRHRGLTRSGLRQQRRRGIFMCNITSACSCVVCYNLIKSASS